MSSKNQTHRRVLRQVASSAEVYRLLDTTPPVATDRALRVAGGGFYVSGGVATMLLAILSSGVHHRVLVALIGGAATITGLAVIRWSGHVSGWMRRVMNLMGTTLVMCIVLLCGSGDAAPAAFWMFSYVPVDSFFFFPWRWAVPMVGWGFVASAIAALGSGSVEMTQRAFSVLVGVVSSTAVGALVRSAANAEWDSATETLSRKGLERELERRCHRPDVDDGGFSLACLSIQEVEKGGCSQAQADLLTLQVARRVRAGGGPTCQWARMRDHQLGVIIDECADVDGYLDAVRDWVRPVAEVSIGVTDWHPGERATELIGAAMSALHHSQSESGVLRRSGVVAARVAELRRAIIADEIRPHYQPIVALQDGTIVGAEALARWYHPEKGVLPPAAFIGLAEQAGLIGMLGESILRRACAEARSWPLGAGGTPLKVTVNVSGEQLCEPHFHHVVADALRDSGLAARRLVLEVTESTLYGDDPVAHETLRHLRGLGTRIAVDDFGTGFSNLSRLAHLPADVLKVDRSFVADLETGARVRSMLSSLAAMSHELGFRSLVEGVETPDQARILRSLGIVEAQGFFYGRPVSLGELVTTIIRLAEPCPPAPGDSLAMTRPAAGIVQPF